MLAIHRYGILSAVDTAFWVYGRHFRKLATLGLVLGTVNIALGVASLYALSDLEDFTSSDLSVMLSVYAGRAAFLLISAVVAVIVGAFGTAAATVMSVEIALDRDPSLGGALRVAVRRFGPVLKATLISGLAGSLALIPLVLPGVYVSLGFAFIAPVIVQEDVCATDSLGRSWRLARGLRGRLLGGFLLVVFVLAGFSIGIDVLMRVAFDVEDVFVLSLTQTLVGGILNAVLAPIYYLVVVLFYFGARVEHEAFDVQVLADS